MSNNLRATEIQEFLAGAGWGEAARTPLNADASTRRYERLRRKTEVPPERLRYDKISRHMIDTSLRGPSRS